MSMIQIAWLLFGIGALSLIVSLVVAGRRFFFSLRAVSVEGAVTSLEGSGFPTVSFTPGDLSVGGRVYTFQSSIRTGSNAIGQKVRVYYDPKRPQNATIVSSAFVYFITGMAGVLGTATCWGVGAMLAFWVGPTTEARDTGVARFLAAVERGDPSAIRSAAAEDAQLDYAFLEYLRGISGFDEGHSTLDSNGSCIRGMIGDHQITMKVVQRNGEWRVLRAANLDPLECDEELSGR
jgi:hypothetical protein